MSQLWQRQSRYQQAVWLVGLGIFFMAFILFLELGEDVWLNEGFSWEITWMLAIHGWSQPWLDRLFWLITQTAGALIVLPVLGTAVWFWWHEERITAVLFAISFGGTFLLNSLLKLIFARPRPELFPPLAVETSYSFPSGHTMSAIAFYGLLAFILWQRGRRGWAMLFSLWVPLVALSRVYLGAHYPSDVLASLAIGTMWLVSVWLVYTWSQPIFTPANLSTTPSISPRRYTWRR